MHFEISELIQDKIGGEAGTDAVELDVLLSEVTLMHTRAELFWRFLRRRLNRTIDEEGKADAKQNKKGLKEEFSASEYDEFETEEHRREYLEHIRKNREERANKLDLVLNRSRLNTRMQVGLFKALSLSVY